MAIIASLVSWYFRKRWTELEFAINNAADVQQKIFESLISDARNTEWGKSYDYKSIATYNDYKNRVPVGDYEKLKPLIERNMKGEQNLLWPSDIKWFAKSSGTTSDKSKFIPVSFEGLDKCHYQGGRDVLTIFCNNNPETNIFDGKGLVIGGSHKVNNFNDDSFYGDLSAVMMSNTPFWVDFLRTPDKSIALMEEWEEKIEKMATATVNENVTNISGVPTWTLVLIERLFEMTGKKSLLDIWPNLELYVHGGVSFVPYRERFRKVITGRDINYLETYNASEGFFGIQESSDRDDMLLMVNYGIFYEFIPADQAADDNPDVYCLAEVKPDVNYAVVISTNCGLWRYILGDTVKFTSVAPYRFRITGRTKLFINAFGEELVIENAERAIAEACMETKAIVREFTAAPIFFGDTREPGHEWLVEFEQHPTDLAAFTHVLDTTLKSLNSDYEAKRYKDIAIKAPRIRSMESGTFHNWLKTKGKLGGQHKVPRLSNDRRIIDEILETVAASNQ